MTNAICQSYLTMQKMTSGGASIAPSEVPVLSQPAAIERSLAGNHWLIVFMPAGKIAASLTPSMARNVASAGQLMASP